MANQPSVPPGPSSGSSSSSGFQSPFGDTTLTKVFVGGLAWETKSETMRQYFEQFGEILEAVVINDKNTGRSKGYGFVTFRDPESAGKACVDPAPVIDGRRANCNLASLGRPRPAPPLGHITSPISYARGMQTARVPYIGGYGYQQPLSYSYQQGLMYPSYPYAAYGPEYIYPQIYGAINTPIYPYNPMGQIAPGAFQGYALPSHPSVNATTTTSIRTIQAAYPTGVAALPAPIQGQQFVMPAPSSQLMQGGSSDQSAG